MTSQQPFTQRLRAASKSQHAVADALVVAKLLVAFTDSALYGAAIGCFFHVYQAIESNLHEQRGQPGELELITAANHVSWVCLQRVMAFARSINAIATYAAESRAACADRARSASFPWVSCVCVGEHQVLQLCQTSCSH